MWGPKHGGECATTIGPPLWFEEADTKPKMVAHKSPRRNNRARWFLVSAFALLRLVIVRVAMRPTATDTTDDTANTPPAWARVALTPEQAIEGRRTLCDAVRDVLPDIDAGTQGRDVFPLLSAIQSAKLSMGPDDDPYAPVPYDQLADAEVRQAWMGYLMYRWKETDCPCGPLPDGVIDPTSIGEFAVPWNDASLAGLRVGVSRFTECTAPRCWSARKLPARRR
jgi:hypothetical protein